MATTTAVLPVQAHPGAARRSFASGAVAMSALLAGMAPFGVVVGMAAAASESPSAAAAGTWLIYSGSAHLAVLGALGDGSGVLAVVCTGLLVNARLLAFSASLAPAFRSEPLRFRLAAAALLVDPLWALVTGRAGRGRDTSYYLGAGLVLWFGWAAAVSAGMLAGQGRSLDWAAVGVPICLVAVVVPHVRTPAGAACATAAAVVGTTSAAWPSGTVVLAGMVAGTAAAAIVRRRTA
jgi:predicted branched-subunit amino acid permease